MMNQSRIKWNNGKPIYFAGGIPLILLTVLTLGLSSCLKETPDTSTLNDSQKENETKRILAKRFQDSQAPVARTVINDSGQVGQDFKRSIELKGDEIFTNKPLENFSLRQYRLAMAALVKNNVSRTLAYRSSLDAITRRSQAMTDYATNGQSGGGLLLQYDLVIVGAGPSAAIAAQEALLKSPYMSILIVDEAQKPGGTFAEVMAAFFLNSTNRENRGERASPGRGDLNYLSDLLGLPDFEALKWPVAGKLGQLVTMLLDLSSANVLLRTRVESISQNDPGIITLKNVDSGRKFEVKAKKFLLTTGLGKPRSLDNETKTSVKREKKLLKKYAKKTGIEYPGSFENFSEFSERLGQSETPLRPYINQTMAFIGGGDSAKVGLEYIFRLGPEEGYGRDFASVGKLGKVYWFAEYSTCEEFLVGNEETGVTGSRSRYSRLFGEIASGKVILVPVDKVLTTKEVVVGEIASGIPRIEREIIYRANDGKTYSSLQDGMRYLDFEAAQRETVNASLSSEQLLTKFIRFKKSTIRHTVSTIGFVPTGIAKLFQPFAGDADLSSRRGLKSILQRMKAPLREYGNQMKAYGLKFKDPLLYRWNIIGAASTAVGLPLPDGNELARVFANTVSIFANGPRIREFMKREVFKKITSSFRYSQKNLEKMDPVTYASRRITMNNGYDGKEGYTKVFKPPFLDHRPTANSDLELLPEIDRLVSILDLKGRENLKIVMTVDPNNSNIILRFDGIIESTSDANFLDQWMEKKGSRLAAVLHASYFHGDSRIQEVKVEVPIHTQKPNGVSSLNTNRTVISARKGPVARRDNRKAKPRATIPVAPRPIEGNTIPLTAGQVEQLRIVKELMIKNAYTPAGRIFGEVYYMIALTGFEFTPEQMGAFFGPEVSKSYTVLLLDQALNSSRSGTSNGNAPELILRRPPIQPETFAALVDTIEDIWSQKFAAYEATGRSSQPGELRKEFSKILEEFRGKVENTINNGNENMFGRIIKYLATDLNMVKKGDSQEFLRKFGNLVYEQLPDRAFETLEDFDRTYSDETENAKRRRAEAEAMRNLLSKGECDRIDEFVAKFASGDGSAIASR